MDGLTALAPVGAPTKSPPAKEAGEAKFHRAAQQFEAMFMGEMLRQAHPASKATGVFAAGPGKSLARISWTRRWAKPSRRTATQALPA